MYRIYSMNFFKYITNAWFYLYDPESRNEPVTYYIQPCEMSIF